MTDQEKYEAYKRYNWEGDEKWQAYLNNMTVTQNANASKIVEKKRRQWYKKNKVSDFNVDYEPQNDAQPTNA